MSQTDLNVANASGAAVRADLNAHLDALVSLSSGATEPATKFPNQWWYDTSVSQLKKRNNANTAWLTTPQIDAVLDTNGNAINESEGTAVASAATTNIWATNGNTLHITGAVTITSFGTAPRVGAWRKVIFDSVLTLTNGANLNLQGGANITTAVGDFAFVYADTLTQFDVLYFKKDGTAVVAAGTGGLKSVQVFTTTGANTWTKPADITAVVVEVQAGGGGGGGAITNEAGGGGGGGGYTREKIDVTGTSSETATVGAGGAGGAGGGHNAGSAGGTSSFGSFNSATGGSGGAASAGEDAGGAGGIGADGSFNVKGSGGGASAIGGNEAFNFGGASHLGGGARQKPLTAGEAGGAFGGGGSGSNANAAGGAGANGIIIVWEYS